MLFQSIDLDRRQGRLSSALLIGLFVCSLHGCTVDESDPAASSADPTDGQDPGAQPDAPPTASGALQLDVPGARTEGGRGRRTGLGVYRGQWYDG